MVSLLAELTLAGIMLGTGSINTVSKKVMYQTNGTNIEGTYELYKKPWLCTLVMFSGESMCMLIFYAFSLYYKMTKNRPQEIEEELIDKGPQIVFVSREETESDPTGGLGWRFPLYVTLFSACDLLSTTLTGIGLVYCNASVIQILRGFVIVFTMLNAWFFLGRKPKLNQVVGVCFAIFGLIMVGSSAVLNDYSKSGSKSSSVGDTVFGICLTLSAQIFSSIQFVFEEKLLKQNTQKTGPIPSLFLVGAEGISGFLLSLLVALPIVNAVKGKDHGSYENFNNSLYMMVYNPLITAFQFLYFISIAFFNWSSFVYSKALSATARTLVDACRTIVVWLTMVGIYGPTDHKYGEGLTYWSILQVIGFIFMLLGTTTHNNIAGVGDKFTSCCKNDADGAVAQK